MLPFKSLHFQTMRFFNRRLYNLFLKDRLKRHSHHHEGHEHHFEIDPKIVKPGISNMHEQFVHDESFIKSYAKLIEGNKIFVQEKLKHSPNYFKELSKSQHPDCFFISCSDSRVPPNELLNADPGEIFVHRNIANQVKRSDLNCQAALFYAVEALKVSHIIVLGHTHCGGIAAAAKNQSLGVVDLWLQNVRDIAVENREELSKIKEEQNFLSKLTELNIKVQTLNVCKSAVVQKAWAEGKKLRVSGWMFDLETGYIKDLDVAQKDWEEIKRFFQFSFKVEGH